MSWLKIYIDADACPVKSICAEVASYYQVQAVFVCSYASHFNLTGDWVHTIAVDQGFQSVDLYIANQVKQNDIVITDDYGLACIVLSRGCLVLSSRGKEYTKDNIDQLLMNRHVSQKARMAGKRTTGPKPLTVEEKELFKQQLEELLREKEGDC